jgi:hypothetical protein
MLARIVSREPRFLLGTPKASWRALCSTASNCRQVYQTETTRSEDSASGSSSGGNVMYLETQEFFSTSYAVCN